MRGDDAHYEPLLKNSPFWDARSPRTHSLLQNGLHLELVFHPEDVGGVSKRLRDLFPTLHPKKMAFLRRKLKSDMKKASICDNGELFTSHCFQIIMFWSSKL
jgi:hypothetical protein